MIKARTAQVAGETVKLDALPDVADFRDRLFEPSLIEVPTQIDLSFFKSVGVPVSHQGSEGSCTGFALATVAHYLLRVRRVVPDEVNVSSRMFYEMAKRYDEWPGESYEGSSARGAVKGWNKHGVCAEELWPYQPGVADRDMTSRRSADAMKRPLGAYYRINQKDLVAMHSAIADTGVLFATSVIHEGWISPNIDGSITPAGDVMGGHAFAIVGYNAQGFWVQNSWGGEWGIEGCALLTYDDWLDTAMDAWVAQLGVPINVTTAAGTAVALSGVVKNVQPQPIKFVSPFVISVGANGQLRSTGTYATSESDLVRTFEEEIPTRTADWQRKRLMLFAHSGLESEERQLESILELGTMLVGEEIYPLAFHWHSDFFETLERILQDALSRRRPQGKVIDFAKEFMLDRLDSALEPLVRSLSGKLLWDDLKSKGVLATKNSDGAGRIFLRHLVHFLTENPDFELHVVAHSVGSLFLAPLIQLMAGPIDQPLQFGPMKGRSGQGLTIRSCTLWAPAVTVDEFAETYLPPTLAGGIERLAIYTLTDQTEREDNVAHIYHKSLLYLASNALGQRPCIPMLCPNGDPMVGMEKDLLNNPTMLELFSQGKADWVIAPNGLPPHSPDASGARSHIGFEKERATVMSTLSRMNHQG
jgi:hypothetical protein